MFAKVSDMFAEVSAVLPKLNLSKALLAAGYTGVAAVFVSALAYLAQFSVNSAAATLPLTLTFLALNALAWWFGNYARTALASERIGRTPLMLGDLLLLLNLYTLFYLYIPPLEGRVYLSLTAALLVGIVYHLYWYRLPGEPRLPAPFYGYFFVLAGGAALYLTRWTLGAPPDKALWMTIGFGVVMSFATPFWRLRPQASFLLAIMFLFAGAIGASFGAFKARPTLEVLLAWGVVAAVLFVLSWGARDFGPAGQALGFGFYCSFTAVCTATLYYMSAPPYYYVIFTTVWIGLLTAMVVTFAGKGYDPFAQPAYWLSVLLGLGFLFYWREFWSLLARQNVLFPFKHAFALPLDFALGRQTDWLTPVTLVVISLAFLVSSVWQRRYPTIALSMGGYALNYGLVTVTSYLPLLLLAPAGAGLWMALRPEYFGTPLAPFALGVCYLSFSLYKDSLFPRSPLKTAGYLLLFVSAAAALYNAELATATLAAGALVLFRHGARARSFLAHLFFLILITGAALPAAVTFQGQDRMLSVAAPAVALLAVYRVVVTRQQRYVAGRLTMIWSIGLALAVGAFELTKGQLSPLVFFSLWFGFLLAPGGAIQMERDEEKELGATFVIPVAERDRRLRIVGYWVAHAAGAAGLIALLKWFGVSLAYAGPAVALWAWGHFALSRRLASLPRHASATVALHHSAHGFAMLSILLAALYASGRAFGRGGGAGASFGVTPAVSAAGILVACLLSAGALYFVMAQALAEESVSKGAGVGQAGAKGAGLKANGARRPGAKGAGAGVQAAPLKTGAAAMSPDKRQRALVLSLIAQALNLAAIVVAARTGAETMIWACAASAFVFLWRSERARSFFAHLYFLGLMTLAAAVAAFRMPVESRMLLVSLLGVALLLAYRWLLRRQDRVLLGRPSVWTLVLHVAPWAGEAEALLTLLWAIGLAAVAGVSEGAWGRSLASVYAVIWAGFLVGLRGRDRRPGRELGAAAALQDRRLRIGGFWVAHAAGAACLIATARSLGMPAEYAGPAIALWAWIHLALSRRMDAFPRLAATAALRHSIHGFALVATLLAASAAFGAAGAEVLVACLLLNGALYFQMAQTASRADEQIFSAARRRRWLRLTGEVLNLGAILAAVVGGARLTIWACSFSAIVYLWRSAREQSFFAHVCFLGLSTAAASVAAVKFPGNGRMLWMSLLAVALLLAIYPWLVSRKRTRPVGRLTLWAVVLRIDPWAERAEGPLTLLWAIALAAVAGVSERVWGQSSAVIYLPIWIGFLIGLKGRAPRADKRLLKGQGGESTAAAVEQKDWRLRIVGYWVAHAAGVMALVSTLRALGWPPAYTSVAVVAWAWTHFGLSQTLAVQAGGRVVTPATRHAVHGFALTAMSLAIYYAREGSFSVAAAFLTGLLYLVLRQSWGQEALEDVAALSFITAFSILGVVLPIALPDYYLSLVGLYLCFVLYRSYQKKMVGQKKAGGRKNAPWQIGAKSGYVLETRARFRFESDRLLPLSIVGVLVAYPFWSLMTTLNEAHIYFLGGATVLLLYLFMKSRQFPIFVYLVCLFFVVGAVYLLAFGRHDQWVNLFLAVVGPLVIASQVFIGNLAPRRLSS